MSIKTVEHSTKTITRPFVLSCATNTKLKKTQNEIRFGFRRRSSCCARRSSRSKRRHCLEIRKRQHRSRWIQFRVSVNIQCESEFDAFAT